MAFLDKELRFCTMASASERERYEFFFFWVILFKKYVTYFCKQTLPVLWRFILPAFTGVGDDIEENTNEELFEAYGLF